MGRRRQSSITGSGCRSCRTSKQRTILVKRFPLPNVRLGYHHIRLYWMQEPSSKASPRPDLSYAPARTYSVEGRVAGVAVSLYGLRSKRNWGCGDFTDLRAVIDAFAPAGVAFLALNPLHAIANREPYNTSPYLPQCSLYPQFHLSGRGRVPAPYAARRGREVEAAARDRVRRVRTQWPK